MSTHSQAFISGEMLRWARLRRGTSTDKIAEKIHAKPEQLISWEQGEDVPTFRQAQTLAHLLSIPFGYLFLSEPPRETTPLPDFRTFAGSGIGNPSPELIDTLYDVLAKQDWYRDFLLQTGSAPLDFVGRFRLGDDISTVAADIQHALGIDEGLRNRSNTWEEYMRALIRQTELAGVIVLRTGMACGNTRRPLPVREVRGFAISDTIAPLVFINSRDSRAAQIFTLAHEIAHIWIGASGISDESLQLPEIAEAHGVERFCNAVAAEVLTPRADFVVMWSALESIDANMRALSHHYKVSTLVILQRACDLGKISRKQCKEYYHREEQRYRGPQSDEEGGNFWNSFFARNSRVFSSAVIEATNEGRLLYREAARLLNVRVPTLQKISEQIGKEAVA